ncbi:ATP-dependent DNA helicase RecG [Candidatus Uhrbacteria bacterium]|nr:ATP-dependent DNA helicase RecG [Candidatus Uhrbacteria bacterium]
MSYSLDAPIASLSRFAKIFAGRLKKLGITTVRDLLFYFPFRYDDLSNVVAIRDLMNGVKVTVQGTIDLIANRRSPRKHMLITEALIRDATGSIKVVWFQQPFLAKVLPPGTRVALSGVVEEDHYGTQLTSPSYEKMGGGDTIHTGRRVPVYSLTSSVTEKQFRTVLNAALPLIPSVSEWIPKHIRARYQLIDIQAALKSIHFPEDDASLALATRRLKFDELFLLQLRNARSRQTRTAEQAPRITFHEKETKAFVDALPFTLTDDQKKAAWEIIKDMSGQGSAVRGQEPIVSPMHRLLEGDVGSGKTVVAAIVAYNVILSGYRVLLMAPTEILAEQHAQSLIKFFSGTSIHIGLWTASHKLLKKEREEARFIIGTHAILHAKEPLHDVGLVIIDEQHRFGVEQRKELRRHSGEGMTAHLLSMTATPIPRTLALTLYGDLDLSILKMMPRGRKVIETRIVEPHERVTTEGFIANELKKGRQAFVICPLIDPSDTLGVRSATQEFERLKKEIFLSWTIGLLHGRMKAKEKEATMRDFKDGKIHLLVSTAVVEVGVDVPNATIMMIEGAERFGLAQLHQFRGRVGRGEHQSYCFLFADTRGAATKNRLAAVVRSTDGFALAEEDLKLRGSGDLFGTQQSGVLDLRIATLGDTAIIHETQRAVQDLVAQDSTFAAWPELKARIEELEAAIHPE